MSWEDQGRQEHGWFGHGTAEADMQAMAQQVAYGALGHLPAAQRSTYESWLAHGGLAQVAEALPGWVAGSRLTEARFHEIGFGPHGMQTAAGHAQAVGQALTDGGDADAVAVAGRRFADLVRAVRPEAMGRVMAGAVAHSASSAVRSLVQQAAARRPKVGQARGQAGPAHAAAQAITLTEAERQRRAEEQRQRNVDDLARVIYNEARAEDGAAMTAVGWTLRNRMLRNSIDDVRAAWGGYNFHESQFRGPGDRAAYAKARRLAEGILDRTILDPTGGATHYYSPKSMRKEDKRKPGSGDERLESVDGVTDDKGFPIRNYRPTYSLTFPQISVPGISDRDFKFYRQPEGHSRVR